MHTALRSTRETSIIEYPHNARLTFWRQLTVMPFETAIALISVWGGLASLIGLTAGRQAFSATLPPVMVNVFNVVYILSGLAIVLGIGWGYRNLEACGLILLVTSLVVRGFALVVAVGPTRAVLVAQVSSVVFIIATVLRLIAVARNVTVAHVKGPVAIE